MTASVRLVFRDKGGAFRPFLKVSLTSDGSVVVAPVAGVPGLLRTWDEPLQAEVPEVAGLHLTVHGNGEVHVRGNGSREDLESLRVPPLRDFAGASYFLHVLPGPMASYPPVGTLRAADTVVDVADVQDRGFAVLLAFAVTDVAPRRQALPGVDPSGPPKAMRLVPATAGDLHVQAAVVWFVEGELPPPERETWALVRFPDEGDHLPRPMGGTTFPTMWEQNSP